MFLMDCITWFKHFNLKAEFGWGVLLFVSLKEVFKVVGFIFLVGTGLRFFIRKNWHYVGILFDTRRRLCGLRKGLFSKFDFDVEFYKKIASFVEHESSVEIMKKTKNSTFVVGRDDVDEKAERLCIDKIDERKEECELYDEDEEMDVLRLRKMVKIEKRKARKARLELKKEQLAASSAAEETMAMILRLQNEKSLVEMEANQYRRLAEEKQLHDQQVIQSLQRLLLIHEESHKTMETGDDWEESWISSNGNFGSNQGLFRSLDVDLSQW